MKAIKELSYTARFAIICFDIGNKQVVVEEAASMDYVTKILIPAIKDGYIKSNYLVVLQPTTLMVLDYEMKLIAVAVIIKIHRR